MSDTTKIKQTEQSILNKSFDETYEQLTVEVITENEAGNALVRQKPIATEAKQVEFSIPDFDEQVIDETDPNNITITYKKAGVSVAVKNIAISGKITTITV